MPTTTYPDTKNGAETMKRRKRIGMFLVLLAAAMLTLTLSTPGKKTNPATPAQAIEAAILGASRRPEKIEIHQQNNGLYGAVVRLSATDAWSEETRQVKSTYIFSALGDIEVILKGLANSGQLAAMNEVGFFLNAKMKDKKGNAATDVLLKIYFKTSELLKVKWDAAHRFGLANLADRVISYAPGKNALEDFCTDNFTDALEFCKTAARE